MADKALPQPPPFWLHLGVGLFGIGQSALARGTPDAAHPSRHAAPPPPLSDCRVPTAARQGPLDDWASGVERLEGMPPLLGFSDLQWEVVKRGCVSLLSINGGELRRLGWTEVDAFGVHARAPAYAAHAYGLGIMLGDGRVSELDEHGCLIKTPTGAVQSFRRRLQPGAVAIWAVRAADR